MAEESQSEENARQALFAQDHSRAAYFWQVREMPSGHLDDKKVAAAAVIIAEYDASGLLHRLSEIVTPPPYIWCAQAYRATEGIVNRWIPILAGYERIYEHRVRQHLALYPPDHPLHMSPFSEDCFVFGRREIATGVEDAMLIYPDGEAVSLVGVGVLAEVRNHHRKDEEWLGYQNAMKGGSVSQKGFK